MPVKNVELTSIEARRFTRPQERITAAVRVDHNSTVTLVRETSNQEAHVEFRYTASYGGIGIIRMEGLITFGCDAPAITKQWSETAQMPSEMASEVHTTVMRICVPEAVGIAKNLKLPLPIPLPQVQFQDPNAKQVQPGPPPRHESPEVV